MRHSTNYAFLVILFLAILAAACGTTTEASTSPTASPETSTSTTSTIPAAAPAAGVPASSEGDTASTTTTSRPEAPSEAAGTAPDQPEVFVATTVIRIVGADAMVQVSSDGVSGAETILCDTTTIVSDTVTSTAVHITPDVVSVDRGDGFVAASLDAPDVAAALAPCAAGDSFWDGQAVSGLADAAGEPDEFLGRAATRVELSDVAVVVQLLGIGPYDALTLNAATAWLGSDGLVAGLDASFETDAAEFMESMGMSADALLEGEATVSVSVEVDGSESEQIGVGDEIVGRWHRIGLDLGEPLGSFSERVTLTCTRNTGSYWCRWHSLPGEGQADTILTGNYVGSIIPRLACPEHVVDVCEEARQVTHGQMVAMTAGQGVEFVQSVVLLQDGNAVWTADDDLAIAAASCVFYRSIDDALISEAEDCSFGAD